MYRETVVFANKFVSSKSQKVYTRLYVPVGTEVVAVLAEGDCTALAGAEVEFLLTARDGVLQLRLAQ